MTCVKWRFVFAFMSSTGIMLVYMLRVNMSVALVSMVNSTIFKPKNSTPECVDNNVLNSTEIKNPQGIFLWTEEEQATILGSFYWGYGIMQIPCGILSLYFNAKWIYALSTLMTIFLTFLTPLAANNGITSLIALRFFMGLFEGPTYPALFNLAGKWVLESEATIVMNLITSGSAIGTILGQSLSGLIADSLGWQWIFYVMGIIGCVWFVCFAAFTSNSPREHWFISQEEQQMLVTRIIANQPSFQAKQQRIPWLRVFSSKPFFAILSVNITFNFTWYTMINCLPYYIGEVLGFNLTQNGAISSAPYIAYFIVGILSSLTIEYVRSLNVMSKTKLRKSFVCISLFLGSITQTCIVFTGCNVGAAIALVIITMSFLSITNSALSVNYLDIAPNMAGSILSVINVFGTMSGIVTPYIKAYFTRSGETRDNWSNVFVTASSLLLVGGINYMLLASASIQQWALGEMSCDEVIEDLSESSPIVAKSTRQHIQNYS